MTGPRHETARLRRWAFFLAAAARRPREVGTLLPSGPALARRLARVVPSDSTPQRRRVVVELGAGTGEVTAALAGATGPHGVLLAIEKDPAMADALRERALDAEIVTADVQALPTILTQHGVEAVDAIVCVLPWATMPPATQRRLVEMLAAALQPDGVLTAAAYTSGLWTRGARRFRAELDRCFDQVVVTSTLWAHLPPATTYVARGPRR